MYLDRYRLKNRLSSKFTPEVISLFDRYKTGDLSAAQIDRLILDIAVDALGFATEEREKRKYNVPKDINLTEEQYDQNGLRRYSMRNMDDEAVMVPDSEGFWTPVNDVIRRLLKPDESSCDCFQSNDQTSSATICDNCGKEKRMHSVSAPTYPNEYVVLLKPSYLNKNGQIVKAEKAEINGNIVYLAHKDDLYVR